MAKITKVLSFCALLILSLTRVMSGQTADSKTWVTNGAVNAIAMDGNYTYIGGDFQYVGPYTGYGVKLTATDISPDTNFAKVNGAIYTCVADGSGGWYIGGAFTKVGNFTRNNIAHINSDGSVDAAWNPNADSYVSSIALSGGYIYAGGQFTTIGGQARNYIAKLNNTDGSADGTWNPNANDFVRSIAVNGSYIYAGGNFTTIGGQARNYIAKLNNTNGSADGTWNPNANQSVFSLAVSGGYIYAGGNFSTIGGQTRNKIAKLNNTDGSADATWNPNANGYVLSIVVSGSDIYAGGLFTTIGGQTRNYIAKLNNTDGSADATWNPNANSYVTSLAVSGSDIYAGGLFKTIGGQTRNYIAKLNNTDGSADPAWNPNPNNDVKSIAVNGSDIYAGGEFISFGGLTRNFIAKINNTTGKAVAAWNPNANGEVQSIAVSGSDIYAGGKFTTIGGQTRNHIAKLNNTDGSADGTWNPSANGNVVSIAVNGSDIYAGGYFTTIGGQTRNRIAKLNNTDGSADGTWNPNANGGVSSIAISGSDIYAGGFFTTIGGQTRNHIAKLNSTNGSADGTWNPNANNYVNSLVVSGGYIYAGGNFTTIGGQRRYYIAKLNNTDGSADATWHPNPNSAVTSIALSGSNIYAGGHFTTIGGQARNHIARLNNTDGSADGTWNPNANNSVWSIAVSAGDLYIGGIFGAIGGNGRPAFAHFTVNQPPVISDISKTINEDNSLTFALTDFNTDPAYSDPESDPLSKIKIISLPSHGTLTLSGSGVSVNDEIAAANIGNLVYTPQHNYNGSDSFGYNASDGQDYALASKSVNITINAVNDNPTASGIPASISQTEDIQSVAGFSSIVVSDPDAGSGQVTIKFSAQSGTMVYAGGVGISETGIASKNVTFTGTLSNLNFFLSIATNILYTPAKNVNGVGADSITVILNDNGNSGSGGGTDIVVGTIPVNIAAVNDPPVVGNVDGESSGIFQVIGAQNVSLFDNASVSDIDSPNYNGGFLIINQGSGTANGSWGVDGTTATSGGDATITAGETIAVGGTAIGTVHATNDGQGGNTLEIDFNSANSTSQNIQTLLRALTYSAPSGLGARTYTLTLNDGDGTANGGVAATTVSFTISVNPNPPVISNLNGDDDTISVAGPAMVIDAGSNCIVKDVDNSNFNGGNLSILQNSGTANGSFSLTGSGSNGVSCGTSTLTADGKISGSEIVFVNGSAVASVSAANDGQGGNNLILNLGSNATPVRTQTLIRALLYSVPSGAGDRTFTLSIKDASTNSATGSANFTVTVQSPTMNLKLGSTAIANNGNYNFGTKALKSNTDATLKILNSGAGSLYITTPITIGGADAGQFSVQQQPSSTINPSDSTTFTIRFTPISSGNKTAKISITNNDASKNPYVLTLNGNGNANPILAGIETSVLNFTEGDAAKQITSTLSLSDADNADMDSAAVQIASNYIKGEDVLSFAQIGSITGVFDTAKGKMTLTGIDTKANYQSALRSVKYKNLSNNPSTKKRTVTFYVNDGLANSDTLSRNINITPVNNPPVLANIEGTTLNYIESSPLQMINITNTITVTDADSPDMDSAEVKITGNYMPREDILLFPNMPNITGTWDKLSGTLKLRGKDTQAGYQSMLRAVAYVNISKNPSAATRTVSFVINDGTDNSNAVTRAISVTPVNNPPVLSGIETTALNFTEGDSPKVITASIKVSDPDNTTEDSASVSITGNFTSSEDVLSFSNKNGITGSYSTATGVLTLTGSSSLANYQLALRSVKYQNTSKNPSTAIRTISFFINDGAANSDTLQRNIKVIAVNNPPVLAKIDSTTLNYTEGNSAEQITKTITVNDVDNKTLSSAEIIITGNFSNVEDRLIYSNQNGISGNYNSSTGVLTLTGNSSLTNYQSALRSVKYQNTSQNPSTSLRTISFFVNDGTANSDTLLRNINIIAVNNPPVVSNIEKTPINFTEGDAPVQITNTLDITDVDNTNMDSAVVSISGNYKNGEDVLSYTKIGNITGVFNTSNGNMVLSGNDSKANYQSALRSVKYQNTSQNPSTSLRTISFFVNDGTANSDTLLRNINIIAVNNPPVVSNIEKTPINFTEGDAPVQITNTIDIKDVDNTNMDSAVVSIASNYIKGEDILTYNQVGNISGTFNASAGRMVLSGKDIKSNYETALRSVKYIDNSKNPSTVNRVLTYYVNDGTVNSDTLTRNIIITAVDNAPVLANIESKPLHIKQGKKAYQITSSLTLSDVDNSNLDSAVVKITSNYEKGKDSLVYKKTGNITGTFDSKNASLILTGKDTKANYQSAIRSIKYENGKSTPVSSNRTISITVSDGKLSSNVLTRDIIIVPSVYFLYYNYPNPFNPSTTITYSLPEKSKVHLILYDILGRKVLDMVNDEESAGYHKYKLNSGSLASGVYIYVLSTVSDNGKKFVSAKKMLLLK